VYRRCRGVRRNPATGNRKRHKWETDPSRLKIQRCGPGKKVCNDPDVWRSAVYAYVTSAAVYQYCMHCSDSLAAPRGVTLEPRAESCEL
jgi:hypothetical protein